MTRWNYELDVSMIWNVDFAINHKSTLLAGLLLGSKWAKLSLRGDQVKNLAGDLIGLDDERDFNRVWNQIYDLADLDRCWINTMEEA